LNLCLFEVPIVCYRLFELFEQGMKPPPHVCEEQKCLLSAYEDAVAAYWAAVTDLRGNMEVLKDDQYKTAYKETEDLRMAARTAEEALHQHLTKHGC
jgi:hypothetical protein